MSKFNISIFLSNLSGKAQDFFFFNSTIYYTECVGRLW